MDQRPSDDSQSDSAVLGPNRFTKPLCEYSIRHYQRLDPKHPSFERFHRMDYDDRERFGEDEDDNRIYFDYDNHGNKIVFVQFPPRHMYWQPELFPDVSPTLLATTSHTP